MFSYSAIRYRSGNAGPLRSALWSRRISGSHWSRSHDNGAPVRLKMREDRAPRSSRRARSIPTCRLGIAHRRVSVKAIPVCDRATLEDRASREAVAVLATAIARIPSLSMCRAAHGRTGQDGNCECLSPSNATLRVARNSVYCSHDLAQEVVPRWTTALCNSAWPRQARSRRSRETGPSLPLLPWTCVRENRARLLGGDLAAPIGGHAIVGLLATVVPWRIGMVQAVDHVLKQRDTIAAGKRAPSRTALLILGRISGSAVPDLTIARVRPSQGAGSFSSSRQSSKAASSSFASARRRDSGDEPPSTTTCGCQLAVDEYRGPAAGAAFSFR